MNRLAPNWTCGHWIIVVLVVVVAVQPLALPLHEYNLRQDGYTLVYGNLLPSGSSGDSTRLSPRGADFYPVAQCLTHFLLHSLEQFQEMFGTGLGYLGLLTALARLPSGFLGVRKDEFLSELILRAPPVPSAQVVS